MPKFELAAGPQTVGFTERNMGIDRVVSDFAKKAITSGKVREIKGNTPLPSRQICMIRGSDIYSTTADKLFDVVINDIK